MKKNHMRNEMLLQNYTPSQYKLALSGKATDKAWYTKQMATKKGWMQIFNDAIADLKEGNFINGKAMKNMPEYWQKQIKELDEFVPFDEKAYKETFDKENYKHIHLKISNRKEDVIKFLESKANKNGYIIELIEKDMRGK